MTAEQLRGLGYSERTVWLVEQLTRPKVNPPSYMDYIRKIATSGDRGLIAIKLADNADNLDPVRVARLPKRSADLVDRYKRARHVLRTALALLD
jgi:hypothetical protein